MKRRYSKWATQDDQTLLKDLLDSVGSPSDYQAAMVALGRRLGDITAASLSINTEAAIVTTAEDADFLSRGIVEAFEQHLGARHVHLVCFWNDRRTLGDTVKLDVAPIVDRYMESLPTKLDILVVAKSIVAEGCTVRTNIQEIAHTTAPGRIVVLSPVVLKGAPGRIRGSFRGRVAEAMTFTYIAEDSDCDETGNVLPGIGGQVYNLLGFASREDAQRHLPKILEEREQAPQRGLRRPQEE